jgi:hypothetical protein
MRDTYETPFDRYETPFDGDRETQRVDAGLALLGLPRSVQAPAVEPAAVWDNPSPVPGACANNGNTESNRLGAA